MDRYKNGGCRPCQQKKQRVRNRADATGRGNIYEANAKARQEAKLKGESTYESLDVCPKCQGSLRYTSGGNCYLCHYVGSPEDPDNKPGLVKN
ncbi:MAG: hypothetical protein Alis3KO_07820 [Aliiglaciecola sp.]